VHAVVKDFVSKDAIGDIKQKIRETLRNTNIQHSTIEIEFSDEECVLIDC
jgi:Co/Zn/Cd efflux system component